METGILYVIYNKWISNPETHEVPYKIGITKGSIEDRYYGLGLTMPGKFETLFAYKLNKYAKAEQSIHVILDTSRINGEWFMLSQEKINLNKQICITMEGIDITSEIEKEIVHETEDEKLAFEYKKSDNYNETQEIDKIRRKIEGWFTKRNQINSKILYSFIFLYQQNNGVVTFEQLRDRVNIKKFKSNFDQMKNFGEKNHGKIFDQIDQNIYLWEKVKDIIWDCYKKNIEKENVT